MENDNYALLGIVFERCIGSRIHTVFFALRIPSSLVLSTMLTLNPGLDIVISRYATYPRSKPRLPNSYSGRQ